MPSSGAHFSVGYTTEKIRNAVLYSPRARTTTSGNQELSRTTMENKDKSWKELCAEAAIEKDPQRLTELVTEILRLLDAERKKHDGAIGGAEPELNHAG